MAHHSCFWLRLMLWNDHIHALSHALNHDYDSCMISCDLIALLRHLKSTLQKTSSAKDAAEKCVQCKSSMLYPTTAPSHICYSITSSSSVTFLLTCLLSVLKVYDGIKFLPNGFKMHQMHLLNAVQFVFLRDRMLCLCYLSLSLKLTIGQKMVTDTTAPVRLANMPPFVFLVVCCFFNHVKYQEGTRIGESITVIL